MPFTLVAPTFIIYSYDLYIVKTLKKENKIDKLL